MNKSIFFICFCQFIFGQEIALEFKNELQLNSSRIKESYTIVNEENNDLTVLLSDLKKLYVYQFDSLFNKKNQILTKDLPSKYKELLGYQVFGDEYTIFFSNKKKSKFGYKRISFKRQLSMSVMMDHLDLKKERFLQTISHKNKFYLLTVGRNTSKLFFYEFNQKIDFIKHEVDLSSLDYVSPNGFKHDAYSILGAKSNGFPLTLALEKIDVNNPNPIESTSSLCKLYIKEDTFVLTFDNRLGYARVYSVDSNTFEVEEKKFDTTDSNGYASSNSFIFEDNIFHFLSSSKHMKFIVRDFNTSEIIKEFFVKKEDSITFKNSPIIQEGGEFDKYREMEKTAKFLRKISSSDVGISVYKLNDNYQITLGGKKELQSSGAPMMMPMGGGFGGVPIAGVGGATFFFNASAFAYGSYTNTKSTYINCLFDADFNHVAGDVLENVFDKINNFKESEKKLNTVVKRPASGNKPRSGSSLSTKINSIKAETIQKYKGHFLFGYYYSKNKIYYLRKFED